MWYCSVPVILPTRRSPILHIEYTLVIMNVGVTVLMVIVQQPATEAAWDMQLLVTVREKYTIPSVLRTPIHCSVHLVVAWSDSFSHRLRIHSSS
ncbi:hypothetical protein BDV38DRAFT_256536 [Aspergillus pseudotamarii]|uniref:Uncharacterized protein n=1 Tax=Aspergillus pseudotamarii TaxID=132259 RepID=A0A5N6SHA8_ASPPS|nr:uncharacterized protein BDV38DRAFT_256536 [Aspergillus pseudotamarii]KAE8134052.1 hypothetical protein BDV38DRAFT_256536 [Aspergillus pseudotamarii]